LRRSLSQVQGDIPPSLARTAIAFQSYMCVQSHPRTTYRSRSIELRFRGINTNASLCFIVVDLVLALTAVSTLAVLLGVIIGVRELRHFSRVREADVIRAISEKVANPEFIKNFLLIEKMNYKTYEEIEGKPEEVAMITWLTYIEGLALAVKRGIVPLDVVDDYWHGTIRTIWTKCEPVLLSYREKYSFPEIGEWTEYLYLRIYGKQETEKRRVAELEKKIYSKRIQ